MMKSTNDEIYRRLKDYIFSLVKVAQKKNFVHPHLYNTEKWVLKLKPNADFALRIAALMHDIDRVFIKNRAREEKIIGSYKNYKSQHIKNSLNITKNILKQFKVSKRLSQKILFLIKNHEGGIKDTKHIYYKDLQKLIDADSLAFFDELTEYYKTWGKKTTDNKIKYSWSRLSKKAKKLCKRDSKKIEKLDFKVPSTT